MPSHQQRQRASWLGSNKLSNCLCLRSLFGGWNSQWGARAEILGTKGERLSYQDTFFSVSHSPTPSQQAFLYIIVKQISKDHGLKAEASTEPVNAPNVFPLPRPGPTAGRSPQREAERETVHVRGLLSECPWGKDLAFHRTKTVAIYPEFSGSVWF